MQTIELAKMQANLVAAMTAAKAIKAQCVAEVAIANAMHKEAPLKRNFSSRGNKL